MKNKNINVDSYDKLLFAKEFVRKLDLERVCERKKELQKQRIQNEKIQIEIDLKNLEYKLLNEHKILKKREQILNNIENLHYKRKQREMEQLKFLALEQRKQKINYYYNKIKEETDVDNLNEEIIKGEQEQSVLNQGKKPFKTQDISCQIIKENTLDKYDNFEIEEKKNKNYIPENIKKHSQIPIKSPFLNFIKSSNKAEINMDKHGVMLGVKFRERMKEYSKYQFRGLDDEDPINNKILKNQSIRRENVSNKYLFHVPFKFHYYKFNNKPQNHYTNKNPSEERLKQINSTINNPKLIHNIWKKKNSLCNKCKANKISMSKDKVQFDLQRWETQDLSDSISKNFTDFQLIPHE